MNKLTELFLRKKSNLLSIFFTAGYPALTSTGELLNTLQESGADLIEIGIPFSDPLADGPVIQASSEQAIRNRMNLPLLFQQLKEIKNRVHVPLILMGYLNPVLQFGVHEFCKEAAACGISGVILPDLPFEIYQQEYAHIFKEHDLKNIFLVTEYTEESRIRLIDEHTDSFIYLVASSGTTGNKHLPKQRRSYFERIKKMQLRNPVLCGFGISDRDSFREVCSFANGAIIGSAFIRAISNEKETAIHAKKFIQTLLNQVP